jgi:HSP20 family molecular chaperone IbpA
MSDIFDYFFGYDKQFNYCNLGGRIYRHISKEDKEILTVNVAGFAEEDIKIEPKNIGNTDYLYVIGTPKENVQEFIEPMNIRFVIKPSMIGEIYGKVVDGMLYITATKKENKPNIKINFGK